MDFIIQIIISYTYIFTESLCVCLSVSLPSPLKKVAKNGKNWQKVAKLAKVGKVGKVTKVAEVEKSGKKWIWFDQIQIKHKPSAGASRWLTVRSANPASGNNSSTK